MVIDKHGQGGSAKTPLSSKKLVNPPPLIRRAKLGGKIVGFFLGNFGDFFGIFGEFSPNLTGFSLI